MQPQDNPYGFITSAPQQPTSSNPLANFTGGGNSMQKRIIVVVGGAVILIILFFVVSSILSSAGKGNITIFSNVAKQQSEIVNISMTGETSGINQVTKNLAMTAQISIGSSQTQFLALLSKDGSGLHTNQTAENNPTISNNLTAAITAGTFDTTYLQTMQSQLTVYQTDLSQAFKATQNKALRTLISSFYSQAKLLQSDANSAAQSISS